MKRFQSYPRYDWTDRFRKGWWTFRIIFAFLILLFCVIMLKNTGINFSIDSMIYIIIGVLTLIRLPGKFKRRKIFKEAIEMMKTQANQGPRYVDEEARRYWEQQNNQQNYQQNQGYQQDQNFQQNQNYQAPKQEEFNFFANCKTMDEVDKTFKNLAKIYHPDQASGNNEMFGKISEQYSARILENIRNKKQ